MPQLSKEAKKDEASEKVITVDEMSEMLGGVPIKEDDHLIDIAMRALQYQTDSKKIRDMVRMIDPQLLPPEVADALQLVDEPHVPDAEKERAMKVLNEYVLMQRQEMSRAIKPIVNTAPKIGRNDACPCASGRKYKKCCMHKSPSSDDGTAA